MIISQTPLRISIGGGGTDLPSFYSQFGSFFISAAIDKYIYIIIQPRQYYQHFLLKYSKIETCKTISSIKHDLIRESLKLLNISQPLEIVSFADIPSQTGLGSSGAFTVGLLNALYAYKKQPVSKHQLAKQACHIAINTLNQPSGKQDEYISTFGGLTAFTISKSGQVTVKPNPYSSRFAQTLFSNLFLFYTNITRLSTPILSHQQLQTHQKHPAMINNLKQTQQLGFQIHQALKSKNANQFGLLLHQHWLNKTQRSKTTNSKLNRWYQTALNHGALGGKIIGAGKGGFFLFYCPKNKTKFIQIMEKTGLRYTPFNLDLHGTQIISTRSK